MESAVRKEQDDRNLLVKLEQLDPEMQLQLVRLVKSVSTSAHAKMGTAPIISAAGFELLSALHNAARPGGGQPSDLPVSRCGRRCASSNATFCLHVLRHSACPRSNWTSSPLLQTASLSWQ
jgi:hypothetical protein